ncbi:MAG: M15 family peptidase [Balneolaceae bacterium]|nr:MAG: M15 family peptidase [Balneolaceae bacterium]
MQKRIKLVQQLLRDKGLYNGNIDGIAGPKTMGALAAIDGVDSGLPKTRQITTYIQITAQERNIDVGPVDGLWGPRTNAAFDELAYQLEHGAPQPSWRPDEIVVSNPRNWPVQRTAEFNNFYGERGTQLVMIDFPYEMKLAWDLRTKTRRTRCHARIADSLQRVLQKVKEIYGEDNISRLQLDHFGGCYNDRPIRNGSLPSMHSWGIALDFDPSRNQLNWGRDRASLAHPDYYDWWSCWEEEGWISLGRKRNFDWMHVQAARLPE